MATTTLRRGALVITPDGRGRVAGFDWDHPAGKPPVRAGALVDLGRDDKLRPVLRHFKLADVRPVVEEASAPVERVSKFDLAAAAPLDARCAICGFTKDDHGRMAFTCPPRVGAKKGTMFEPVTGRRTA